MLVFLATLALGQETISGGQPPDLNAQFFRSTADAEGLFWTDLARRAAHGRFTGRLLAHYTRRPLSYLPDQGERIDLVDSILQTDLIGGYAFQRLRVGAVVPLYVRSKGDAAGGETGLGDAQLDARLTLLDPSDAAPLALGLQGRLTLPTATVRAPLGDPTLVWSIAAVADVDLSEQLLLALNVGFRGGPRMPLENVTVNDSFVGRLAAHYTIQPERDVGIGAELASRFGLAGDGDGAGTALEWLLGGHGRLGESPLMLRAGVGTGLTGGIGVPTWRAVVGIGWEPRAVWDVDGDGIVDDDDACKEDPEDRDGFEDADGCPDPDNDQDGVLDVEDRCPLEAEDPDGFEDENGCPDPDNDQDGLADTDDACPTEPEDQDGYKDGDGCPDPEMPVEVRAVDPNGAPIELARIQIEGDGTALNFVGESATALVPGSYTISATAPGFQAAQKDVSFGEGVERLELTLQPVPTKVEVTRERIHLKDKVYFDTGKATIQKRSYGLLDSAVQILKDYPEIRKLRIEGHTDSRGSESYNLQLSQARADAVRQYFIDHGVEPERLVAVGYGESRPLDPAQTRAAYAKNRRVDFFVEEWSDDARSP